MNPITDTCEPRQDVLQGALQEAEFAAQLELVVRGAKDYESYTDADTFFSLSYPSHGLKRLLHETFARLSGDASAAPFLRSETSFGGGKTHSLIAAYHLAKGANPSNLDEFVDPRIMPETCQVAAVVGEVLDPVNGTTASGRTTYTLWGEIGSQLGDEAWDAIRRSEEAFTAPGKEAITRMIGGEPTVIIIDEIAHYIRTCASAGRKPDVQSLADSVPAFLKTLAEVAASSSNIVVILTLATRQDAYAAETDEVEQAIADVVKELRSVASRTATVVQPASEDEIALILKRRLFDDVPDAAAQTAAEEYEAYYTEIADRAGLNPADATDMARRLETTFPFHPALVEVLDRRVGTLPNFQRTRGALRLVAHTIRAVWASDEPPVVLNVADVPLHSDAVLRDLTVKTERPLFQQVAEQDICGPQPFARSVDNDAYQGRPIATRAATCVFAHSLEQTPSSGASETDVLYGTLAPGDDPSLPIDGLRRLAERAWFLITDGMRWRFQTEPNPNRIIGEEAERLRATQMQAEREQTLRKMLADTAQVATDVLPDDLTTVADEPRFHLVVPHHDEVAVDERTADRVPELLKTARAKHGNRSRTYRNGIGFLVADEQHVDVMDRAVRRMVASHNIVNSPERMGDFGEEIQEKLKAIRDKSKLEAHVAVGRCYRHLYYPDANPSEGDLRHVALTADVQGTIGENTNERPWTAKVWETLETENKVRASAKPLPADWLKRKVWPHGKSKMLVRETLDHFWRDHSVPMLREPSVVTQAIQSGIDSGEWVYVDARQDPPKVWSSKDAVLPSITYDEDDVWLYELEAAQQEGLLAKLLTPSDIEAVLSDADGPLSGPALRTRLTERLGGEPTKEMLGTELAALVSQQRAGVLDAEGEPVTAGILRGRKADLDNVTVQLPDDLGDDVTIPADDRRPKVKAIPATSVGKALETLRAWAQDSDSDGLTEVTLSMTIDKNVAQALGVLTMLGSMPTVQADVTAEMVFDLAGIGGDGMTLDAAGDKRQASRIAKILKSLDSHVAEVEGELSITFRFDQPEPAVGQTVSSMWETLSTFLQGEQITLEGRVA